MTVPKAFIEQNGLAEGSKVELKLLGSLLTVHAPERQRYALTALLTEMPDTLPLVAGWDDMEPVGLENA